MATEILRPNAAGDETNITSQYPDSDEHWDKVDDETPDEVTTFVKTKSSTYKRDLYNLPAPSGAGLITKVTLYFRVMTSNSQTRAKGAIKSNSTVTETAEKNPYADFGSSTWGTYSQEWSTNPADSKAWEWSDIDSLQIGVSLKGDTGGIYLINCTQVYVEVDYTLVVDGLGAGSGVGLATSQSLLDVIAQARSSGIGLAQAIGKILKDGQAEGHGIGTGLAYWQGEPYYPRAIITSHYRTVKTVSSHYRKVKVITIGG